MLRLGRLVSIQFFVIASVLGVLGSTFFLYYRASHHYNTRESFVWLTTAAEIELARYSNALLKIVATEGRSQAAIANADLRFEILLSRLGLYRKGQIHAALIAHPAGPAILAQIDTIEASIDPSKIDAWTTAAIDRLEKDISSAALILRDASLILLRREEMDNRDLLNTLDASVVASAAFFVVGSLFLIFFLRARGEAQRVSEIARVAAEAARRAAAEQQATARLIAILEQLPIAVLTTGPDDAIRWINRAAEEIFGVAAETARGRPLSEFLPSTTSGGAPALPRDPVRMTGSRPNGIIFPLEASVAASMDADGTSAIWMVRDITQQVQHEQQRQKVEEDRQRARRLESLGTLAGGIAHELNSPIQFLGDNNEFLGGAFADLRAALEALRDTAPSAVYAPVAGRFDLDYLFDEIPEAIAQSRIGLERIAEIILATRRFLHPALATMEDNDINRIVETAVLLSKNQWRYAADLQMSLAPDLPRVRSNAGELNQVLINLIANAVHAIEDKGQGMGRIEIATRPVPDAVEIAVSDSGIGIAPHLREKVFDLFFTTKAPGRGTGQGLPLVHAVVTQTHGGRIVFDSEPGQGTCFRITLPCAGPVRHAAAT